MGRKNWLSNPQFREFNEALGYAKSRTMWLMADLNKLTDEQIYWCWHIIQHGLEYNRREDERE